MVKVEVDTDLSEYGGEFLWFLLLYVKYYMYIQIAEA